MTPRGSCHYYTLPEPVWGQTRQPTISMLAGLIWTNLDKGTSISALNFLLVPDRPVLLVRADGMLRAEGWPGTCQYVS